MTTKKYFGLFLSALLIFMASCGRDHRHAMLTDIEASLNEDPELALMRLDSIDIAGLPAADSAFYAVQRARARYGAFIDLHRDTMLEHALEYYGKNDVRDKVVATAHYLNGLGLLNDSLYTEGMFSLHRAYTMASEVGHDHMAGMAARELAAAFARLHYFEESQHWAEEARARFGADGNEGAVASLDPLMIESYFWSDKPEEALAFYESGVDRERFEVPGVHRTLIRRTKADALIDLGRYDAALSLLDSIACENEVLGAYHWNTRADLLLKMGRIAEAEENLARAHELLVLPSDTTYYIEIAAKIYAALGDYREAYRMAEVCMDRNENVYVADKRLHPGSSLINYYVDQEQAERRAAEQARTISVLSWSLVAVLALFIAVGSVVTWRYIRRRKAERRQLEATVEELKGYIDSNLSDISKIDNMCSNLFSVTKLASGESKYRKKVQEIKNRYSGPDFMALLGERADREHDGWLSRLRADYPSLSGQMLQAALLLYFGFSTDAIAFILDKSSTGAVYTLKSRMKNIFLTRPELAPKYLAELALNDA